MIYILYGSDFEKKNSQLKEYAKNTSVVRIPDFNLSLGLILNYAEQNSLFGERFTVILENPISKSDVVFSAEVLETLKNSASSFIFLEDKLLLEEIKKYKKYTEEIEKFDLIKEPLKKENPFVLANMFGSGDKIGAWVTYRSLVEKGSSLEAIAGMLFWKIKTMILSGGSNFGEEKLKKQSSELIDIYHKSHLGLLDMDIALEQFILKNL